MELLLNSIWVLIAVAGFVMVSRLRHSSVQPSRVPSLTAFLALACLLLLLFPIVSASDDLHPTQPVLEDASKRIQHGVVWERLHRDAPFSALPSLPLLALMAILLPWQRLSAVASFSRLVERERVVLSGRSPPTSCPVF
jgi:hypothetical protein